MSDMKSLAAPAVLARCASNHACWPRATTVGHVTQHQKNGDALATTLLSQLEDVQLHVHGRAALMGADMTDPGTLDWWAKATLSLWPDDDEPDEEWASAPGVALSTSRPGAGERELVLFEADGLLVELRHVEDVFDALDARSQDYAQFIPLFGDTESFGQLDLNEELEDSVEALGSQVVIIDRARLAPAWRGLGGVGRLLIGRLLRWVSADPRVVAVHPFPIDLDMAERQNDAVFKPALEQVQRVWASLGFTPLTDRIWIMDPHLADHAEALARLARRLRLE